MFHGVIVPHAFCVKYRQPPPPNLSRGSSQIEGTGGQRRETCRANTRCLPQSQTGVGNRQTRYRALGTALPLPRFENAPGKKQYYPDWSVPGWDISGREVPNLEMAPAPDGLPGHLINPGGDKISPEHPNLDARRFDELSDRATAAPSLRLLSLSKHREAGTQKSRLHRAVGFSY